MGPANSSMVFVTLPWVKSFFMYLLPPVAKLTIQHLNFYLCPASLLKPYGGKGKP